MSNTNFLKKASVQAAIVGAFGGMAPKFIELIPKLFNNIFPSSGYILALILLAIIGAVVVIVYKEGNLQKALVLGAGAPAILATLTANVVNQNPLGALSLSNISIFSVAQAQTSTSRDIIKFVVTHNASPYQLNALWFRADFKSIEQYQQIGDMVIVSVPQNTKEIRINLSAEGEGLIIPASDIPKNKNIYLEIREDKNTRDFWKAFGNVNLPKYKIVKVDSRKP